MATATHEQPRTPSPRFYAPNLLFSPILLASTSTNASSTRTDTFAPRTTDEMSAPIPISPSSPSGSHKDAYASPSSASASSSGLSPHTPFTPLPPTITPASVGTSANGPGGSGGGGGGTGLLRWASLSFGKSPTSPGAAHFPTSAPTHQGALGHGHDHDHDEHHDVFEFGDFNHMAKGSWTGHGRRAASMSMASGANAAGAGAAGTEQSLSAMFAGGFNGMPSPTHETAQGQGMAIPRSAGALTAGSPPGAGVGASMRGGVVADNAAKGVGVLRRLSLSGSLTRPSFLSPTGANAPLPPAPSITTSIPTGSAPSGAMGQPQTSALTNAKPTGAGAGADEGGGLRVPLGQRGRRYSENSARKRGVSPLTIQMGERILRDHGGF